MSKAEDEKIISNAMSLLGKRTSERKKESSRRNIAIGRKKWLKQQRRNRKNEKEVPTQAKTA